MLQRDPSVDWAQRIQSTTDWNDDGSKPPPRTVNWWDDDYQGTTTGSYQIGAWRKPKKERKEGEESDESSDWSDDSDYDYWGGASGGGWAGMDSWLDEIAKTTAKFTKHNWHHVAITVVLGENSRVVTYVDGLESKNYKASEKLELDGPYSLVPGQPAFLLGGLNIDSDELKGGAVMWLDVATYAATALEVENLYKKCKSETEQWDLVPRNVENESDEDEDEDEDDEDEW
eukprot:TRINITY_DN19888_c0_g1_i1.p2 TRINITY_DN19888_c0_g1~~TRINITY_DN19888_c0_g1_i1.p2  ORF type:complete len:230 (-),score=59.77 TRINITY_DN19888_c0_g1_i1:48-737(-)